MFLDIGNGVCLFFIATANLPLHHIVYPTWLVACVFMLINGTDAEIALHAYG